MAVSVRGSVVDAVVVTSVVAKVCSCLLNVEGGWCIVCRSCTARPFAATDEAMGRSAKFVIAAQGEGALYREGAVFFEAKPMLLCGALQCLLVAVGVVAVLPVVGRVCLLVMGGSQVVLCAAPDVTSPSGVDDRCRLFSLSSSMGSLFLPRISCCICLNCCSICSLVASAAS